MDEIRSKAHSPPRGPLTLVTLRGALICRNQEKARGEKELMVRAPSHLQLRPFHNQTLVLGSGALGVCVGGNGRTVGFVGGKNP